MKVASVVFEEDESFVKFGIEGLEVVHKAPLLAEPLQHRLLISDHDFLMNQNGARTFARKKLANGTFTEIPSYIALPMIRPMKRYQSRLCSIPAIKM
jgi:hypothetical protein